MAWDDKTRKLTIDPDDLDSRVAYDGTKATVTFTEYSPYKSGRSNKQVVLKLDDWFLARMAETLGEMFEKRENRIEQIREKLREL